MDDDYYDDLATPVPNAEVAINNLVRVVQKYLPDEATDEKGAREFVDTQIRAITDRGLARRAALEILYKHVRFEIWGAREIGAGTEYSSVVDNQPIWDKMATAKQLGVAVSELPMNVNNKTYYAKDVLVRMAEDAKRVHKNDPNKALAAVREQIYAWWSDPLAYNYPTYRIGWESLVAKKGFKPYPRQIAPSEGEITVVSGDDSAGDSQSDAPPSSASSSTRTKSQAEIDEEKRLMDEQLAREKKEREEAVAKTNREARLAREKANEEQLRVAKEKTDRQKREREKEEAERLARLEKQAIEQERIEEARKEKLRKEAEAERLRREQEQAEAERLAERSAEDARRAEQARKEQTERELALARSDNARAVLLAQKLEESEKERTRLTDELTTAKTQLELLKTTNRTQDARLKDLEKDSLLLARYRKLAVSRVDANLKVTTPEVEEDSFQGTLQLFYEVFGKGVESSMLILERVNFDSQVRLWRANEARRADGGGGGGGTVAHVDAPLLGARLALGEDLVRHHAFGQLARNQLGTHRARLQFSDGTGLVTELTASRLEMRSLNGGQRLVIQPASNKDVVYGRRPPYTETGIPLNGTLQVTVYDSDRETGTYNLPYALPGNELSARRQVTASNDERVQLWATGLGGNLAQLDMVVLDV